MPCVIYLAFNDLKRRYLISQYNVGILKEERGKITIELCRATDQLELFKKENEQLNISVADKNSAYSKLEELYKQQTKSAQRSEEYSKELFQKVQKLASEKISYENELNKAIDENEKLSRLHEKLVKENAQVSERWIFKCQFQIYIESAEIPCLLSGFDFQAI